MPKAFIYCRVSTDEQAQDGYSLETQERYCRQFAEHNGYRVASVFRDEGRSGTTLDRPALQDLLARLQNDKSLNAVIVQETDRLARNTKDHLTIRALLQQANVKLISIAQPMLDDSPEGNMIDTIIASVNQFQSDINSRKTKKGLKERFDSGWWPGWAPLGYRNEVLENNERVVVPDPESWSLLQDGLKEFLKGDCSAIKLARYLHERGLRSKTGRRLCNSIMTSILKNPFYAGIMRWNGQEKEGKHKPMISVSEHERILKILDSHNHYACRKRKHNFLLHGFIFCNMCGGRYTAEKHLSRKVSYYHCDFKGKRGKDKPHSNVGQNVDMGELEKQVEEEFKKVQFSDGFVSRVIVSLKKRYNKWREKFNDVKQELFNRKLAIEQKRDAAEEKLLEGTLSNDDYTRIRKKLEYEGNAIQDKLDELELQRAFDMNIIEEVLKISRDIYTSYKKAPLDLKRLYLSLFWQKFFVQDKKIVKATPTPLIAELLKEKNVMVRSDWLPRPSLTITLQDVDYMDKIKRTLYEIKKLLNCESQPLAA